MARSPRRLTRARATEVRLKFSSPLHEGIFQRRYKRFFAEIDWRGQTLVAHVPNTGSMKGCNRPGLSCRFSESDDPKRKLKYTLEMVRAESGAWVGVNTQLPNRLVREALDSGLRPQWASFDEIRGEVKLSAETRLDFALSRRGDPRRHFIEVKNVTLAEGGVAMFPDAVTERGSKHLRELVALVAQGHGAELVFTVQREDAEVFAPAREIDPLYADLLREAHDAGVVITPLRVRLSAHEAVLTDEELSLRWE